MVGSMLLPVAGLLYQIDLSCSDAYGTAWAAPGCWDSMKCLVRGVAQITLDANIRGKNKALCNNNYCAQKLRTIRKPGRARRGSDPPSGFSPSPEQQ
jgi:hypothetical protein